MRLQRKVVIDDVLDKQSKLGFYVYQSYISSTTFVFFIEVVIYVL